MPPIHLKALWNHIDAMLIHFRVSNISSDWLAGRLDLKQHSMMPCFLLHWSLSSNDLWNCFRQNAATKTSSFKHFLASISWVSCSYTVRHRQLLDPKDILSFCQMFVQNYWNRFQQNGSIRSANIKMFHRNIWKGLWHIFLSCLPAGPSCLQMAWSASIHHLTPSPSILLFPSKENMTLSKKE